MKITFKRKGCNMISVPNPTPHDVGVYLHMAAAASNAGDLEIIQIINNVQDPVKEVRVISDAEK